MNFNPITLPDSHVIDLSTDKEFLLEPFRGVIDFRTCQADADITSQTVSGGWELEHHLLIKYTRDGGQSIPLYPGQTLYLDPEDVEAVSIAWIAPDAAYKKTVGLAGEIVRSFAGVPDVGKRHAALIVHAHRQNYEIRR